MGSGDRIYRRTIGLGLLDDRLQGTSEEDKLDIRRIINSWGPVTGVSNPVYWSPGALNSSIGSGVGSAAAFSIGLGVSTR